jgi:hypothetical protein
LLLSIRSNNASSGTETARQFGHTKIQGKSLLAQA